MDMHANKELFYKNYYYHSVDNKWEIIADKLKIKKIAIIGFVEMLKDIAARSVVRGHFEKNDIGKIAYQNMTTKKANDVLEALIENNFVSIPTSKDGLYSITNWLDYQPDFQNYQTMQSVFKEEKQFDNETKEEKRKRQLRESKARSRDKARHQESQQCQHGQLGQQTVIIPSTSCQQDVNKNDDKMGDIRGRKKNERKENKENNLTIVNDVEKIEVGTVERITSKRFVKPTLEEISLYCQERRNQVNPEAFCDYYETNGWMVGKNRMKDWQASVRTWERNSYNNSNSQKNANLRERLSEAIRLTPDDEPDMVYSFNIKGRNSNV